MNEAQTTDAIMHMQREIAGLKEGIRLANKQIDETGKLVESVNRLAREVTSVAEKVGHIADRMDKSVERIEQGQKDQGKRIGNIENVMSAMERTEKTLEDHGRRIGTLEKAPADKWNKFTWLIFTSAVTAVLAFIAGKLL